MRKIKIIKKSCPLSFLPSFCQLLFIFLRVSVFSPSTPLVSSLSDVSKDRRKGRKTEYVSQRLIEPSAPTSQ